MICLIKLYAKKYPETFDDATDESLVYCGSKKLTDILDGTELNIGKALLSPTRTFTPVIKMLLKELPGKINGLIHNTGGAQTKVLHYIENLRIVKDNLLPIPPIFKLIQQQSNTGWREMYKVLNCGTKMEVYAHAQHAAAIISISHSFGIDAQVVGYVEHSEKNEVVVRGEGGEFVYN